MHIVRKILSNIISVSTIAFVITAIFLALNVNWSVSADNSPMGTTFKHALAQSTPSPEPSASPWQGCSLEAYELRDQAFTLIGTARGINAEQETREALFVEMVVSVLGRSDNLLLEIVLETSPEYAEASKNFDDTMEDTLSIMFQLGRQMGCDDLAIDVQNEIPSCSWRGWIDIWGRFLYFQPNSE